jgi:hypothetical protein
MFMGRDRMHLFPPVSNDGQLVDTIENQITQIIKDSIYPDFPLAQQNQSAMQNCWMNYSNEKIYLGIPQPGSTSNNVIWVYDMCEHGWTRFTGINTNNSISVDPGNTSNPYGLYLFQSNGQVSVLGGNTDLLYADASPIPISFSMTVHGGRPGFLYRFKAHPLKYRKGVATSAFIECALYCDLTITASGYDVTPYGWSQSTNHSYSTNYQFNGNMRGFRFNLANGMVNDYVVSVNVSGSSNQPGFIKGIREFIDESTIEH